MNKTDFFEAVKNGVLENLKKTDETLEATINKVSSYYRKDIRYNQNSFLSLYPCNRKPHDSDTNSLAYIPCKIFHPWKPLCPCIQS